MPANYTSQSVILDHAQLLEEVEQLEDAKVVTLDGLTAYSGNHPVYGFVNIVCPALGAGLMFVTAKLGAIAAAICAFISQFSHLLPILSLSAA